MVEKNERKSADSNELADYLTTKRIEFSYSTGKLGKVDFAALKGFAGSVRHVVFEPHAMISEEELRRGVGYLRELWT